MDWSYILILIIVLLIITVVWSLIYHSANISNTELGKSMIGNLYQTTEPTTLNYSMFKEKFNLQDWRDKPFWANPRKWESNLKLPTGLVFEITEVHLRYNMFNGYGLDTKVKIIDDINFNQIEHYLEADDNMEYILKKITDTENPYLSKIIDKENRRLKTKNLTVDLYTHYFFNYENKDLAKLAPLTNNDKILNIQNCYATPLLIK